MIVPEGAQANVMDDSMSQGWRLYMIRGNDIVIAADDTEAKQKRSPCMTGI